MSEEIQAPKLVKEEVMCCGYKRCPTVKFFDDGSVTIIDNDPDRDSVGKINIRPEAAEFLRELLEKHKK